MAIPNANQLGLPSLKESFKIVFVKPEILLDKNWIDVFCSPTLKGNKTSIFLLVQSVLYDKYVLRKIILKS